MNNQDCQNNQEYNHIADIVGEWGKWQFELTAFVFLLSASAAFINMGYNFHAKTVDFWCNDVPINYPNITKELQCFKYVNPNESCTQWQYNTTQYRKSIITEFDLVCDRANYASLTQSFFMFGYIFSGLVISHYSDKYGRRPMVWLSYSIELIGIISCGLSVNIYQYLISRFLVGLGYSGGGWAVYTILLECCGPKHRSDIVILAGIGWVLGYSLLPGFAYWLRDFRYLQLGSAIPLFLMCIWFYFLYESPRWQITNGRTDQAEITIRKALRANGLSVDNLKEKLKLLTQNLEQRTDLTKTQKSYNLLDLLKTSNLRKYTLIFWYSWIANALIYYGFSLNMSDFGGNFYITFLLSGLVELPSPLLTPLLLRYVGRRRLYSTFMTIIALSCLAVIPSRSDWLKVTFVLIGKFGVSTSWNIMAILASEVYPTVIRNTGLGVAAVVGRIGSASAPFMGNLAVNTSLMVVMLIYGSMAAIGAILGLYLPETKDREIPDTIEEVENFDLIQMKTISRNDS